MKTGPIPPFSITPDTRRAAPDKAVQIPVTPAATPPDAPDFRNLSKADYVAWGKSQFARGRISLDDLFQVQFAGGDFDGTVNTDTAKHDFVGFFEGLIRNEVQANRGADKPQSMVPAYQHVLASMATRFERTV